MAVMTDREKRAVAEKWSGEDCTLNGKPARVTGRLEPFASVRGDDGITLAVYSWEAVSRVMESNRKFKA